jgi:iron-sulfur cluster insertion protein
MRTYTRFTVLALALASGCAEPNASPDGVHATPDTSPTETEATSPAVRKRAVVKLTDSAIAKFKEFLGAEPTKHIRLSVKNEGPTGFMYDLKSDDSINDSDFVDRSHGFLLVVDPKSSIYLDGATIDWHTQADGQAGFKFDNPNAVEK